jgi:hypothetical protein
MHRKVAALFLIVLTLFFLKTPSEGKAQSYFGVAPYTYIISTNSTSYFAQKSDGSLLFSSTNGAVVINDAIGNATAGGRIFIKAGTYIISGANIAEGGGYCAGIGSVAVNGIELTGEGAGATILKAATNLNCDVIGANNVNHWYIHDLQVDGSRASQSASGGIAPFLNCITIENSAESIISNLYVHDCKTYGIQYAGTYGKILNNHIQYANANGIIVQGSYNLAQDNTINGFSDVGISLSGPSTRYLSAISNVIMNGTMNSSPFGVNSADGILIGDNGEASYINVIGNHIINMNGPGISTNRGGHDYNIKENIIVNTYRGITPASSMNVNIEGNLINGTQKTAILVDSTNTYINIMGNQIYNYSSVFANSDKAIDLEGTPAMVKGNIINYGGRHAVGIYVTSSNNLIEGNIIKSPRPYDYSGVGIYLNAGRNNTISNNQLYYVNTNSSSGAEGIYVQGSSVGNLIINNKVAAEHYAIWLNTAGTGYNNTVMGNIILGAYNGIFDSGDYDVITQNRIFNVTNTKLQWTGNHTLVLNNNPYNLFGKVTNFVYENGTSAGDGHYFSVRGTTSAVRPSVDYVMANMPWYVTSSGGVGVSITIKDAAGNTIDSGMSTITHYRLEPGWRINFGAYTYVSPPTVTATAV